MASGSKNHTAVISQNAASSTLGSTSVPSSASSTSPAHLNWLTDTNEKIQTADGQRVWVMEFRHVPEEAVLSAWAKHLREHYCHDRQIDRLRKGTSYSRSDYLTKLKFPGASDGLGPSTRAGDFGEILVADYLEYRMRYWVPRSRYDRKVTRNESTKGCDIIGFKFVHDNSHSADDKLALIEAKTDFSGKKPSARLQEAVDHSAKDPMRKAESLNALKQRFINDNLQTYADRVERFQDENDRPYQELFGAVALISTHLFDKKKATETRTTPHPRANQLRLIIIRGEEMMKLVHDLYARAAREA